MSIAAIFARTRARSALAGALALVLVAGGGTLPAAEVDCPVEWRPAPGATTGSFMDEAVAGVRDAPAVVVGEIHDRADHHQFQLELVCRLHADGRSVSVGLEALQWPAQPAIDAYLAGRSDLDRLLRDTGWFERWGYDFRLTAPLLEFARAHHLPVVALNAPSSLTRAVGRSGLDDLDPDLRAQLPARIDEADPDYRSRLRAVFEQHPEGMRGDFESFVDVQRSWDEAMAARAAASLVNAPDRLLVIVAGNGHVAYRGTIADRLGSRLGARIPTIALDAQPAPGLEPTFASSSARVELPARGRIGVALGQDETGAVVEQVIPDGAAAAAGIQAGDRILAAGDHEVTRVADLLATLWRARPGDTVSLRVRRGDLEFAAPLILR